MVAEALDLLVTDASRVLQELSSGQYSFAFDETNRDFLVVDHRNADERRSVRTLSGGETFQASLALALALSDQLGDLAANGAARLESIFLDEGFGTLDPDTLDVVASTIENLARRRPHGRPRHPRRRAVRPGPGPLRGRQGCAHGDGREGADLDMTTAATMKFSVDPWDPAYGNALDARPRADDRRRRLRRARAAGRAMACGAGAALAAVARRSCFRRRRAQSRSEGLDRRRRTARRAPGICASYAAGVVACDGSARVVDVEMQRGLFTAASAADGDRVAPRHASR